MFEVKDGRNIPAVEAKKDGTCGRHGTLVDPQPHLHLFVTGPPTSHAPWTRLGLSIDRSPALLFTTLRSRRFDSQHCREKRDRFEDIATPELPVTDRQRVPAQRTPSNRGLRGP